MRSPPVHVIVLSYNGRKLTSDCIASCLLLNYNNVTIVVADNASTDGSAGHLKEVFANEISELKVILIENEVNLGFAAGNNVGMKYAFDHGAEYVLLLNNDTLVDPDLLFHVMPHFEKDPQIGIIGPKIYYFDPPTRIWFAGGKIDLHKGVGRHIGIRETDRGQFDVAGECDYVTGCAMLISRAVIESVGYLDPIYKMYSEDADYCFRARKNKFKLRYVPAGKVWHKISASSGGPLGWKKIKLRLRSNFIFLCRYARWYHWLTVPAFFVLDGFRIMFSILFGRIKNE